MTRQQREDARAMAAARNEAAERLRTWMLNGDGRLWVAALDAALAAERRATVERLLPWMQHEPDCADRTPEGDCVCGFATALDAETSHDT